MGATTEDLQRSAWRELYEMLSADIEPNSEATGYEAVAVSAEASDEFVN